MIKPSINTALVGLRRPLPARRMGQGKRTGCDDLFDPFLCSCFIKAEYTPMQQICSEYRPSLILKKEKSS